jgi:hypothetical protein
MLDFANPAKVLPVTHLVAMVVAQQGTVEVSKGYKKVMQGIRLLYIENRTIEEVHD